MRHRVASGLAFAVLLTACGTGSARERAGGGIVATSSTEPVETTTTTAPPTTTTPPARPERWTSLPAAPVTPGLGTNATWTDRELIVVGGMPTGRVEEAAMTTTAAAYDPASNRWRRLPPVPGTGRSLHKAVWTGRQLIVWGGRRPGDYGPDGAAYDPATNRWRTIAPSPIPGAENALAAWTGREMVVWGGNRSWEATADGAAYDPHSDRWRTLPAAPIDGRWSSAVTWTGREVVIWGGNGGRGDRNDGAAYDPGANRWRKIAPSSLGPRIARATWTGKELLIFGGTADDDAAGGPLIDGAAYDPAADRWRPIAPPNAAAALTEGTPLAWTGQEMLVAGRQGGRARWVAYRPDNDRWRVLPATPAPDTWTPLAEWTGSDLLAWGAVFSCRGDCTQVVTGQAGYRYTPAS